MPVVVGWIAGYIATAIEAVGVGTAAATTAATVVATIVVDAAISIAVSKIAQALAGKPSQAGDPPQRLTTARGTAEYQQLIYGQIRTGGFLAYYATSGTNNVFLWFVIVLAGHEVTAIDDVWLDSRHLLDSDFSSGLCTNAAFLDNGLAQLSCFKHLGGSTSAVDANLSAACPEWDSSHVGKGVAYIVFQLARSNKVYPSGAPSNFFALVKGRKLYDPRLDSTNGGSGAQRYTDPSTWVWSQNWALALRDYISGGAVMYVSGTPDKRKALGEADARIDDGYIIAAANHADESVTVPIPVLAGTTNWTNGSNTVTGNGTLFTTLSTGNYLQGPNGTMYPIATITDDTHLTITVGGGYPGTSVINEIVHWNTSNSTSTTEARFTADCQLSCGNTHDENVGILLSAGNGKLSYSGGKWCLSAGVYVTPTISLTQDDILGALSVVTHDTTDQCWNYVDGTFFDENNGWAELPFPAQENPAYETDDGRQYVNSIDLQATRGVYRAQRIGHVILEQGRNMLTINASQLSQKALQIKTWDTFNLTIPEYGWTNQVFRCVKPKLLASGYMAMQARSESSAAYADLPVSGYVDPSTNNPPAFVLSPPDAPSGLTITPVINGVQLNLVPPGYFAANQFLEIWEYTSNSPFSSATLIGQTRASTFTVTHSDTATRYYWITAGDVNGGRSESFPSGAGIAGAPLTSQFWSPQLRGTASSIGGTIFKNGGSDAWDSDAISEASYPAVTVEGTYTAGGASAIGLATNVGSVLAAATTTGYYHFYPHADSGSTQVCLGSTVLWTGAAPVPGDRYLVAYDGFYVDFYLNNTWVWSAPLLQAQVYVGLALYHTYEVFSNVQVSASILATPSEWIETGNCEVSGSTAAKIGGSAAWDSCIRTIVGHSTCHVAGKCNAVTSGATYDSMIALSASPTASSSDTNADYAWARSSSNNWDVLQSGTYITSFALGVAADSDIAEIKYDGSTLSYVINGSVLRTVSVSGLTLFGFCPFFSPGAGLNSLDFGPTTTLGVTDTAQLGANASGQIISATASSAASGTLHGTAQSVDIITASGNFTGAPVGIDFMATITPTLQGGSWNSPIEVYITRDGTQVGTGLIDVYQYVSNITPAGGPLVFWSMAGSIMVNDTPSAGSHTYAAHINAAAASLPGPGTVSANVSFADLVLKVREYKK